MAAKALSFDVGDYVVYPKHGVGRVIELQKQEIAGMQLELYVLRFEKEKMTLRVPTNKAESVGMRKLSSDKTLREALETLKGKPKVKRTMWSRRAQEYEAKINSGDLVSIAEVVRDLFRADDQPEQSYSERQIFEAAASPPRARARRDGRGRRADRAREDPRHPAQGGGDLEQGQGSRLIRANRRTNEGRPATAAPFPLSANLVYCAHNTQDPGEGNAYVADRRAMLPLAACQSNWEKKGEAAQASGAGATRSYAATGFTGVELRGSDDVDVKTGQTFSVLPAPPNCSMSWRFASMAPR
jgi:CarD family transcriptional regulator